MRPREVQEKARRLWTVASRYSVGQGAPIYDKCLDMWLGILVETSSP